ncbi:hypothetical protein [Desulfovibrio sp. DV]|uniref:hypothetical protein n=1 Tax=Desulfovibrio sp. DV TaxID=1844708 RepID=UPI0009F9D4E4|nr:hypothetical protein [Desulfovibrio sp. DV]
MTELERHLPNGLETLQQEFTSSQKSQGKPLVNLEERQEEQERKLDQLIAALENLQKFLNG